jgi:hypothetical protein
MRHLPLRAGNCHIIACLLRTREDDLAVPFFLELFKLTQTRNKFPMIESVDNHGLRSEFGILKRVRKSCHKSFHCVILTTRSTISRISAFTSSSAPAFRAGVRQMTLSTLISSSSRPIPPRSMALENLTNTECFFMIR